MGFKKYRGPVETVEQAMMAHAVLVITCQECGHSRRRYAYRLWDQVPKAAGWPLGKPLPGFQCRACRRSVAAVLTVAMM
jgi:hypothetical protein